MPADVGFWCPLVFLKCKPLQTKEVVKHLDLITVITTFIYHKNAWNGNILRSYQKAVSHFSGLLRPHWHISSAYQSLSRPPPLLLMAQPLRLLRYSPWRLEWKKPLTGQQALLTTQDLWRKTAKKTASFVIRFLDYRSLFDCKQNEMRSYSLGTLMMLMSQLQSWVCLLCWWNLACKG